MLQLEPPYNPTIIDVTTDAEVSEIVDLSSLPIRLGVQLVCDGAADITLYGGNHEDGFVELHATYDTFPVLFEDPNPSYKLLKVLVEPGEEVAVKVTLSTKL